MAIPRKFLNADEELLAELKPHWIFLFGPLFTSIGVWAAIIVILIVWANPPGWTNYPIVILALIPGLWLLGRYVRWRSYDVALTSTRILVRQGILGRARGWSVHLYEANDVEAEAARVLGTRADDVLHGPRAALGPPWSKDHRIALAATVLSSVEDGAAGPSR